jgi:hypothetical protein
VTFGRYVREYGGSVRNAIRTPGLKGLADSIDEIVPERSQILTLAERIRGLGNGITPAHIFSLRKQIGLYLCVNVPLLSPESSHAKVRISALKQCPGRAGVITPRGIIHLFGIGPDKRNQVRQGRKLGVLYFMDQC